jgi:hypothetical protein
VLNEEGDGKEYQVVSMNDLVLLLCSGCGYLIDKKEKRK